MKHVQKHQCETNAKHCDMIACVTTQRAMNKCETIVKHVQKHQCETNNVLKHVKGVYTQRAMKCLKDVKGGVYTHRTGFWVFYRHAKKGEKPELPFERSADHLGRDSVHVRVSDVELQPVLERLPFNQGRDTRHRPRVDVSAVLAWSVVGSRNCSHEWEVPHGEHAMHHEF